MCIYIYINYISYIFDVIYIYIYILCVYIYIYILYKFKQQTPKSRDSGVSLGPASVEIMLGSGPRNTADPPRTVPGSASSAVARAGPFAPRPPKAFF